MVVFLHSRGPVRCLLAMALLAWLMLTVAPLGALDSAMQPMQATTTHASQGSMHMGGAGCCADHGSQPGQHVTHPCNCALPCTGVLPTAPAELAGAPMIATRYAPPRPLGAPLAGFAPPLRPPLA